MMNEDVRTTDTHICITYEFSERDLLNVIKNIGRENIITILPHKFGWFKWGYQIIYYRDVPRESYKQIYCELTGRECELDDKSDPCRGCKIVKEKNGN